MIGYRIRNKPEVDFKFGFEPSSRISESASFITITCHNKANKYNNIYIIFALFFILDLNKKNKKPKKN